MTNNEIKDYPICFYCKHFFGVDTCDAFFDKIPDEIFNGHNAHTTPLPNQSNNIVFEPIEKKK